MAVSPFSLLQLLSGAGRSHKVPLQVLAGARTASAVMCGSFSDAPKRGYSVPRHVWRGFRASGLEAGFLASSVAVESTCICTS